MIPRSLLGKCGNSERRLRPGYIPPRRDSGSLKQKEKEERQEGIGSRRNGGEEGEQMEGTMELRMDPFAPTGHLYNQASDNHNHQEKLTPCPPRASETVERGAMCASGTRRSQDAIR